MGQRGWVIVGGIMLSAGASGCIGRAISEGLGVVTGARGKVVEISDTPDLVQYHGVQVPAVTVSPGLPIKDQMPDLIRDNFEKFAAKHGLTPDGTPAMVVSGEIIHYEAGGAVDTAIGPLEEVIIRTKLRDAKTHAVLAEANLIGRSKASSSSGKKNLSEGAGKALSKWFKQAGLPVVKKAEANEAEKQERPENEAVIDRR